MLDLNDLYYFVQVVNYKGFTAAGKALSLPKSSLSHRIAELETRLGARLIQRTSRSFVITDVGREFYEHAHAMLVEAEVAESTVKRRLAEPSGTVRFTCPLGMAQDLAGLLARFLARFPKVNLVQHCTNRYVNLVEEDFDVGLRGHCKPLADSDLMQHTLSRTPWHLFAAPAYLERAGTPTSPEDLAGHAGLAWGDCAAQSGWRLRNGGAAETLIPFEPRLCSDDLLTLRAAAFEGLGIVALPAYVCRDEIRRERLRRVLPEWTAQDGAITLLSPSRRGLLPSVRAFIDFLVVEYPAMVASPLAPPAESASPNVRAGMRA